MKCIITTAMPTINYRLDLKGQNLLLSIRF